MTNRAALVIEAAAAAYLASRGQSHITCPVVAALIGGGGEVIEGGGDAGQPDPKANGGGGNKEQRGDDDGHAGTPFLRAPHVGQRGGAAGSAPKRASK